jgi:hypothetical protein
VPVLEPPRLADYAIWGVALVLYAYDAARRMRPREFLLVEAAGGRLEPSLNESPFTARARVLAFGPLHLPHRGVFVASWGRPRSDEAGLRATLEALVRFRDSLRAARVLAALAFAWLFLAGPALTLTLGPDAAVLYTAAGLYPTVLAAIVALWWRRGHFRLTRARAALLSVEILVCPAFLPNLVRKVTAPYPIEIDGAQLAVATAAPEVRAEFLVRLERRMQAMLDDEGGADATARAQLDAYLTSLRDAR